MSEAFAVAGSTPTSTVFSWKLIFWLVPAAPSRARHWRSATCTTSTSMSIYIHAGTAHLRPIDMAICKLVKHELAVLYYFWPAQATPQHRYRCPCSCSSAPGWAPDVLACSISKQPQEQHRQRQQGSGGAAQPRGPQPQPQPQVAVRGSSGRYLLMASAATSVPSPRGER